MGASKPGPYLAIETGQHAAAMALVLTVLDATPWSFASGEPLRRLGFIGLWSVIMAGLSLLRARRSGVEAS